MTNSEDFEAYENRRKEREILEKRWAKEDDDEKEARKKREKEERKRREEENQREEEEPVITNQTLARLMVPQIFLALPLVSMDPSLVIRSF